MDPQLPSAPPPPTTPALPMAVAPDGRPERPPLVTAIAILDFVAAAVAILLGGLWLVAGIVGASKDEPDALIMAALGGIVLALGALGAAAGVGMLLMRPWGRTCQIVVSAVGLLLFCLGTIVNALILAYLFQRRMSLTFSGRRVADMTPQERELVASGGRGSWGPAAIVVVVAGLLVVIAMTGILAAIAIPNLLHAIQRGKQKRTMVDIQAVATAIEAHAVQHGAYPEASSLAQLEAAVVPTYAASLPPLDGWAHPFDVSSTREGYVLRSAGKDRLFEHDDPWTYEAAATTSFTSDIVFSNGEFVQQPDEGRH